jgi:hypothetical protein
MIWPFARMQENFNILFQQHRYMYKISHFTMPRSNSKYYVVYVGAVHVRHLIFLAVFDPPPSPMSEF